MHDRPSALNNIMDTLGSEKSHFVVFMLLESDVVIF